MKKKPCNCRKKKTVVKKLNEVTTTHTFDEVEELYLLSQSKMYHSAIEMDMMYDLHNRIYPLNKEYNKNCGDCFKKVITNLKREYERQKEDGETKG